MNWIKKLWPRKCIGIVSYAIDWDDRMSPVVRKGIIYVSVLLFENRFGYRTIDVTKSKVEYNENEYLEHLGVFRWIETGILPLNFMSINNDKNDKQP